MNTDQLEKLNTIMDRLSEPQRRTLGMVCAAADEDFLGVILDILPVAAAGNTNPDKIRVSLLLCLVVLYREAKFMGQDKTADEASETTETE